MQIIIDTPSILQHPKTTTEIKECCKDIKVLGRKDLRNLLAWWKVLHEEYTKAIAPTDDATSTLEEVKKQDEKDSDTDEEAIDKQISDIQVHKFCHFLTAT